MEGNVQVVTVEVVHVKMQCEVSSSDKSSCENGCIESCSNLYHYPPIEGQLLVAYNYHRLNISHVDCFHIFLFNLCILLSAFCSITRLDFLSKDFITDSLALYDSLLEDFKLCKLSHLKSPPDFECIPCSKTGTAKIFNFCDKWFVNCYTININISLLLEIIINKWLVCPNGCYIHTIRNRQNPILGCRL